MSGSESQHWNPGDYERHGRFVSDLGLPVLEWLAPSPGERILDLGCGDGALSVKLAEFGCRVVGVDASTEMITAATALGLDARVVDAQTLRFENEFDAVFSNAALHWMKPPQPVAEGVWRALKPGGRFVGEFGAQGNVASIVGALRTALAERKLAAPEPWYFPDAETYRALLQATGFQVQRIVTIPRPTRLPGDIGAWIATFAQPFTSVLPEAQRAGLLAQVTERLRPQLCDREGHWTADYVRLRFAAEKPA